MILSFHLQLASLNAIENLQLAAELAKIYKVPTEAIFNPGVFANMTPGSGQAGGAQQTSSGLTCYFLVLEVI